MAYTIPEDVDRRPVAIDGAGTLGRRIAAVFAAGGSDVRIFDMSAEQRQAGVDHANAQAADVQQALGLHPQRAGRVEAAGDLGSAVAGAWMVVEAVPEQLDLKIEVFGEHYYQPPELNQVELMSCGKTDDGVIDALLSRLPHYGLAPFHVRRESDGFIFNRIWAAIKRECLMVVEEGVATPQDVDELWRIFTKPGIPPFRLMDRVGLDVVLNIEEHYADVRGDKGFPEGPRRLLRELVEEGRLGVKSGRGFYDDAG